MPSERYRMGGLIVKRRDFIRMSIAIPCALKMPMVSKQTNTVVLDSLSSIPFDFMLRSMTIQTQERIRRMYDRGR